MLFGEAVKDELLAVLFDEADKELRAQWETNSRRLAAASAEETNGRRLAAASADLPDNDPGTPALLRSTSWDKELRAQWKTSSRRLAAASADQRDDVDLELQKGLELSLDAARLPTGAVQEDALRNYELFHQLKRGSATYEFERRGQPKASRRAPARCARATTWKRRLCSAPCWRASASTSTWWSRKIRRTGKRTGQHGRHGRHHGLLQSGYLVTCHMPRTCTCGFPPFLSR